MHLNLLPHTKEDGIIYDSSEGLDGDVYVSSSGNYKLVGTHDKEGVSVGVPDPP